MAVKMTAVARYFMIVSVSLLLVLTQAQVIVNYVGNFSLIVVSNPQAYLFGQKLPR